MHYALRNALDRVRNAWNRRTFVTSLSDNGRYPQVCLDATNDVATFRQFRRIRNYLAILEHVTEEDGAAYLGHVQRRPELVAALDRFRANDRHGMPRTFEYPPHGRFSPTTLRYVKVLGDLLERFGPLDGMSVCEIGVGYGGQCRVVSEWCRPAEYCLVDLRPALGLVERYLDQYVLRMPVEYRTLNTLRARDWDLVVSNYALTEMPREVQDAYMEKVVLRARRGYVTYNEINPGSFRSLTADDLLRAIPGAARSPEEPLTHPGNCIITWGPRGG